MTGADYDPLALPAAYFEGLPDVPNNLPTQPKPVNQLSVVLHDTTDGRVWAREFIRVLDEHHCDPHDEGWMIGWFANAIMTGYDAGRAAAQRERDA